MSEDWYYTPPNTESDALRFNLGLRKPEDVLGYVRSQLKSAIIGMNRLDGDEFDSRNGASLFEQTILLDDTKTIESIELHPQHADYENQNEGRFNLFAITGVRITE